jgi:predicted ferric reductase
MINKKYLTIGAIILLTVIPIIIWALMYPLSNRFLDYGTTTHSLGQLTALIGTTLLALTFVLSTRSNIIEDSLLGLDKMYSTHALIGSLAFILLLFHPILLVIKFIPSNFKQAAIYLLPSTWSVNFGIIALLGMIILILLTYFIKVKYPSWKFSHKFMGIVFIISIFHFLFIKTDISNSVILKNYMFFIAGLGVVSYAYSSFLRVKLKKTYEYVVDSIEEKSPYTLINLKPKNNKLNFKAGQFIFLRFYNKEISKEQHPFTIASSPKSNNLRIIIKNLGDFTSRMNLLKKDDLVRIEGPYGKFNSTADNQIWISGGIGLTPFLSMGEDLEKNLQNKKITYYCSFKSRKEAIFIKKFSELEENSKNSFSIIPFYSDEMGLIGIEDIKKINNNLNKYEFFICGPISMMRSLKSQLIKEGVSRSKIHMENFNLR